MMAHLSRGNLAKGASRKRGDFARALPAAQRRDVAAGDAFDFRRPASIRRLRPTHLVFFDAFLSFFSDAKARVV
jgi:hypothetical protein